MWKVVITFGAAAVAGHQIIEESDMKLHTRRSSGQHVDLQVN